MRPSQNITLHAPLGHLIELLTSVVEPEPPRAGADFLSVGTDSRSRPFKLEPESNHPLVYGPHLPSTGGWEDPGI